MSSTTSEMRRWSTEALLPAQRLDYRVGAICRGFMEVTAGSPLPASLYARILDCIEERHADAEITAADIASDLGICERTVHRHLALGNNTFLQALIARRMASALRMLMDRRFDRLSVEEVGRQCGFASATHFARQCCMDLGTLLNGGLSPDRVRQIMAASGSWSSNRLAARATSATGASGRANAIRNGDAGSAVTPVVYFIDQEPTTSKALERAAIACGWDIQKFQTAQSFLQSPSNDRPSCLVVDLALHTLDLQERVAVDRPGMPVILVIGACDAPAMLQAQSAGTVRISASPRCDEALIDAIKTALERGRPAFLQWVQTRILRSRHDTLSHREQQVMALVVSGKLNKEVADELGIAEITVKVHRGSIMRKMQAKSFPGLVIIAARLGIAMTDDECFVATTQRVQPSTVSAGRPRILSAVA